jgi:hypothetical protein
VATLAARNGHLCDSGQDTGWEYPIRFPIEDQHMPDQQDIRDELRRGGVIDMTTTGRTSGATRRIEIVLHNIYGSIYVSGRTGARGWIANLSEDPSLTVHLKQGVPADLPATARIITDPDERRPLMEHVVATWGLQSKLDAFLEGAPLIEVMFDDPSLLAASSG